MIRPLHNRIAVREIEAPEYSPGGIFIGAKPEDKEFVKSLVQGEIIAVGPGKFDGEGRRESMWDLKVGDMIEFSPVGKVKFNIDGQDITMINRDAVTGILDGAMA